jgi:hypothetical protein
MNEAELSGFKDEIKRLALDLLSNETLVVKQTGPNSIQGRERDSAPTSELNGEQTNIQGNTPGAGQSNEPEILFYSRAGIGGDTTALLNDPSAGVSALCSSLLSASAVNRRAVWNFILKALS